MFDTLTRAAATRETTSPKTILGFFAIVLTILAGGIVGLATVLAASGHEGYLPYAIGGGFGLFVAIVASVFITALKDPSRLMLGQMTGSEFIEFQKMTMGDSTAGAHIETLEIRSGATPDLAPRATAELLPPRADEENR